MTYRRFDSRHISAHAFALLAVIFCAALGPVQSRIWNGPDTPGWAATIARALAPSALLTEPASLAAEPPPLYFAFGRIFVLVYFGLFVALRGAPLFDAPKTQRALLALLPLAALGNVLAYWVSAFAGPFVRAVGFWGIEVPAITALLVVASVHGVVELRRHARPRIIGLSFALSLPLSLAHTVALRYLPHGPVLGFALAIAVHSLSRSSAPRAMGCAPAGGVSR